MSALRVTDGLRTDRVRLMNLSYATHLFIGELARRGLRPRSLTSYQTYLDKLTDMYPHHDVDEITADMVRRYLDTVSHRASKPSELLDPDTIAQRVGIIKNFFAWLLDEEKIPVDPTKRIVPPRRKNPAENDNIITVTPEETQRMLTIAARDVELKRTPQDRWRSLLCLGVLAYTGGRRHAVSQLRCHDYDGFAEPPTLRFNEKGGKHIKKPVPGKLADIIRQASLDGVWQDGDDYLIPSIGPTRKAERDDRIIYRVVKDIAADAKVISHVHALRAAFAVYFLESYPDQLTALKNLLGHSRSDTTELYLRRMNRAKGMEIVVNLDWGDTDSTFEAFGVTEKEGFEPSIESDPVVEPDRLPRKGSE